MRMPDSLSVSVPSPTPRTLAGGAVPADTAASAPGREEKAGACFDYETYDREDLFLRPRRQGPTNALSAEEVFAGGKGVPRPVFTEIRPPRPLPERPAGPVPAFAALLPAVLFLYLLYRYRPSVVLVLRSALYPDLEEKIAESQDFNMLRLFLFAKGLFLLVVPLALLRWLELWRPDLLGLLPSPWLALAALTAALAAVETVQYLITALTAAVSDKPGFFARVRLENSLTLTLAALLLTPPVLFYAVSPEGAAPWTGAWTALTAIVLVIKHLTRIYVLFLSEKVSSFRWFLYLCTAEWLPWSFFVLLACRNLVSV